MATALAKTTLVNLYAGAVSAGALDITMAAGDVAGNYWAAEDKQILVVQNSHAINPYTITLASVADPQFGRTRDITAYSLAAADICLILIPAVGYKDGSTGRITVTPENAAIKFGVATFF